jgi:hypothetical protein
VLDLVATPIQGVGDVIRLAVAPVFLLAAVGTMLAVITSRLARVVERARVIEGRADTAPPADRDALLQPLVALAARARLLNIAITLLTTCALLVSMVVITLFLGAFFDFPLTRIIALLFIAAMLSFVGALLCFLREVSIATAALRIGPQRR